VNSLGLGIIGQQDEAISEFTQTIIHDLHMQLLKNLTVMICTD
jgi:hypothetical protein